MLQCEVILGAVHLPLDTPCHRKFMSYVTHIRQKLEIVVKATLNSAWEKEELEGSVVDYYRLCMLYQQMGE